jgi:hypothetical protein
LNGQLVGRIPAADPGVIEWTNARVPTIALELLAPTGNTLEVRAGDDEGGGLDDFLIRNVRVEVLAYP